MQSEQVVAPRSPLVALVAVLAGVGLAKAVARLIGFGVLLSVVAASVGLMTVGLLLLRLAVLN